MQIIFSNHYEALEVALLDDLAAVPSDPLAPQHIVIPSLAIRRRLELGIARRFGICANLNCGYLAQWLWGQIGAFVPVPQVSPLTPNLLVWRLNRLLAGPPLPGADRLQAYLAKADEVMRFELAQRLAQLFDHYLTYRPEWLAAWSVGDPVDLGAAPAANQQDASWQAEIWRRLLAELGLNPFHPAADSLATLAHLAPDDPRLAALPLAAFIFCLPTMPPLPIRLLAQLSRWVDLRLYVLNPCQQYWFEIVDARRLAALAQRGQEAYHETGNQMLASWGKQTQAQIELLLAATSAEVEIDDSRFVRNAAPTLLAALQNAILDLEPLAPQPWTAADQSIAIHSCHHLTRQLEVLQDQLLDLFNGAAPPTPAEVLVVTPDLGAAAPLIDAVFGTTPLERRIPYTITGRPASQENTVARIFLQLLLLPQSRGTASEVFALLQEAPIAQRFKLQAAEQHAIQRWLHQSGIRWGFGAAPRAEGGAASPLLAADHSFAAGLTRLFLGYALPDGAEHLVGGRLPCPVGEGGQALALGRFWFLVDQLQAYQRDLTAARPPDDWRTSLLALVDTFFDADDDPQEEQKVVRAAICEVCLEAMGADPAGQIPLAVLRLALQGRLDDPARGGVPAGRLTFAAMASLRGLPYRVICLLGLDDGAYPGTQRPLEFDLMAVAPKRGDLQRQADERNVFLDLLLAARERLIITYSGRSHRDNAPLPPSVLVDELLDQLLPAIAGGENDERSLATARRRLVCEHPLQAFSPRYFRKDDSVQSPLDGGSVQSPLDGGSVQSPLDGGSVQSPLFSFDPEYCAAARLLAAAPQTGPGPGNGATEDEDEPLEPQQRFFPTPLPPPEAAWRIVSLPQLLRFFSNPCRYLLAARLGVKLAAEATELLDDEPFTLEWAGRCSFSERLLPLLLQGPDRAQVERLAAAGHEFPDGRPGALLRHRELARLHEFALVVRAASPELSPEPLPFAFDFVIEGEAWQLSGALSGLGPQGLLRYRGDDTRVADYLAAWLSHLALCGLAPPDALARSRCLALNGEFSLRAVANARAILQDLLTCYRAGLRQPLHFFPKSAWAFMTNQGNRQKAYSRWQCTAPTPHGEAADPYYQLALRGEADPLAGDFADLAHRIYGPLLEHLEDERL